MSLAKRRSFTVQRNNAKAILYSVTVIETAMQFKQQLQIHGTEEKVGVPLTKEGCR